MTDTRLPQSIVATSRLLREGKVSPVELTRDCLACIASQDPILNAFITVTADSAIADAYVAEAEIKEGRWRGPFHGIPIAMKDIIDVAGQATTAASNVFKDRIATEDAEVVTRLKKAGAILLGRQNMHEFAYGGSSVISAFGPVRNACNPEHIAGGSSGGSATAVAAGMCFAAIGTDTAGSVREPAALCGVVGLKPTYDVVSTRGVFPLAPSLDHVGPITRSVEDAALLLQVLAGEERDYLGTVNLGAAYNGVRAVRIGLPRNFFFEDLNADVAAAFESALAVIQKMGVSVCDIGLDVNPDRTLQAAESFAVHKEFVSRSPELYQPETLRRIRTGESIGAAEVQSLRAELKKMREAIQRVFADNAHPIDLLVTPTTPIPAPRIADLKQNPDELRPREILMLRNTRPFNVWGLPAISIPCGVTKTGLPIGLQISGAHGAEAKVLELAYAFEREMAKG